MEQGERIDREDRGLTRNMLLETGGLLVSKDITLELHVELVKEARPSSPYDGLRGKEPT